MHAYQSLDCEENSHITHVHAIDHTVYASCSLFRCTGQYNVQCSHKHGPLEKWTHLLNVSASCYMYLLHVSEMCFVDNSSNLNVMHNTLWNGSGCINTISRESWPPGTVNVLILQRRAMIKLFHEFQWDSFTRPLQKQQNTITTTQNMSLCSLLV